MSMPLATIQVISEVKHHPDADRLDLAKVLGWTVVVKRDEFKEGDLCLYIALDSIVDTSIPEFAFLEPRKGRITTQKLRGVISQGICFPLAVARNIASQYFVNNTMCAKWERLKDIPVLHMDYFKEGADMTQYLNVTKYEKPVPQDQSAKGNFPTLFSKTDEDNIQNLKGIIEFMTGKMYYATIKHDGTSASYWMDDDGELHVCSRNLELKEGENVYWKMVDKYNLRNLPRGYVVQGEIVGPGIQGNKEGLKEPALRVFNVICIASGEGYLGLEGMVRFCLKYKLSMVEMLATKKFDESVEELLAIADDLKYANGSRAEGMVIRCVYPTYHEGMGKPVSFKVKSNKFMLKHGE